MRLRRLVCMLVGHRIGDQNQTTPSGRAVIFVYCSRCSHVLRWEES